MNRAIKIFTNTNQIPIRKQKPNQNEQSIGSPRQPPQYGAPAKMSGGALRRRVRQQRRVRAQQAKILKRIC